MEAVLSSERNSTNPMDEDEEFFMDNVTHLGVLNAQIEALPDPIVLKFIGMLSIKMKYTSYDSSKERVEKLRLAWIAFGNKKIRRHLQTLWKSCQI